MCDDRAVPATLEIAPKIKHGVPESGSSSGSTHQEEPTIATGSEAETAATATTTLSKNKADNLVVDDDGDGVDQQQNNNNNNNNNKGKKQRRSRGKNKKKLPLITDQKLGSGGQWGAHQKQNNNNENKNKNKKQSADTVQVKMGNHHLQPLQDDGDKVLVLLRNEDDRKTVLRDRETGEDLNKDNPHGYGRHRIYVQKGRYYIPHCKKKKKQQFIFKDDNHDDLIQFIAEDGKGGGGPIVWRISKPKDKTRLTETTTTCGNHLKRSASQPSSHKGPKPKKQKKQKNKSAIQQVAAHSKAAAAGKDASNETFMVPSQSPSGGRLA